MLRNKTQDTSPSLESLPEFFRSPVVPRFNSPFPPLRPDKKYRGVYERAGFEVYKGNIAQESSSVRSNSPLTNSKLSKFNQRNVSLPLPFAYKSDPNLIHSKNSSNRNSQYSGKSSKHLERVPPPPVPFAQQQQRIYSDSALAGSKERQGSATNFHYLSLYSTPGVDEKVAPVPYENIRVSNFEGTLENLPSPERSFKSVKTGGVDKYEAAKYESDNYEADNYQPSNELINYEVDTYKPSNELNDYKPANYEPPYPLADYPPAHESSEPTNYSTLPTNYPNDNPTGYDKPLYNLNLQKEISDLGIASTTYDSDLANTYDDSDAEQELFYGEIAPPVSNLKPLDDMFGLGRDSILKYEETGDYNNAPRLSELIEEEIGASPNLSISHKAEMEAEALIHSEPEDEEEFHDLPQPESTNIPPLIVIQEDYDHQQSNIDPSDEEEESAPELPPKRSTDSAYFNRDHLYELLTGGDLPKRTPDLKNTQAFSDDNEWDMKSGSYPMTSTTQQTSFHSDSLVSSPKDDPTEPLLRAMEYTHLEPRTLDLDSAVEPLSIPKKTSRQPTVQEVKYDAGSGPCRRCGLDITGKSIWSKDGQLSGQWHRGCFSCHKCATPFSKGTNCYVIDDHPYCEYHFHELNDSLCTACGTGIEGLCLENEKREKFHSHCLVCSACGVFIDRDYYIVDGAPLCERDGLIEFEKQQGENNLGLDTQSRIEKRRTRLLQI